MRSFVTLCARNKAASYIAYGCDSASLTHLVQELYQNRRSRCGLHYSRLHRLFLPLLIAICPALV